ncbi:MAG: VOC family protein [Gammaproteobacteria bacterium]|nr:VOC family protein [Gammaproteobacteria bacterium]
MHHGPGLDHVVLCVRDLDAARERFHAMGFTTTPPARHPFGTGNSLVQMNASFIELLTVVDPERIPPHGQASFSFGAFNAGFLDHQEGISMLVISSDDAQSDEARWRSAGLRSFPPVYFERMATQPDGSRARVAFSIAFALDPTLPRAVFFCCQQHAPEAFWQAEYQTHANGARDLAAVSLVAERPAVHASFFRHLLQQEPELFKTGSLSIRTRLGEVHVISPTHVPRRWGEVMDLPVEVDAPFKAAAVSVPELKTVLRLLEAGGTEVLEEQGRLTVPAHECFGMALEFVQGGA